MFTNIRYISALLLLLCSLQHLIAQKPTINASIDNSVIMIGDQVTLTLEATYTDNIFIQWPNFTDSIGVWEVIKANTIDTLVEEQKIKQDITLTIFDEGNYPIPALVIPYKNKDNNSQGQLRTNAINMMVQSPEIDTAQTIKPIKDIEEVPYVWQEFIPHAMGVGALLLCCLLLAWFVKRRKNKVAPPPPAPKLPAGQVALSKLVALEKSKYWQQGKVKLYYSELTEIVREYIEDRYEIQALEMTTDEILQGFKGKNVRSSLLNKLSELLLLSDLVKFAKAQPKIEEHEKQFNYAMEFVRRTKKVKKVDKKEE